MKKIIESTIATIKEHIKHIEQEEDTHRKPTLKDIFNIKNAYPFTELCDRVFEIYVSPEDSDCIGCPLHKITGPCKWTTVESSEIENTMLISWQHYIFYAKLFIKKLELAGEWIKK